MTAVRVTTKQELPNGCRVVEALIVSDTVPDELPVDGKNVIGLSEADVFAPFSLIYVTGEADNKVFIADESGHFVAQ